MKIQMRGSMVGVRKLGGKKKNDNSFFVIPDSDEATGIIKYVGPDVAKDLEVGMKVYYGNKKQLVRIAGDEIEVMENDNIYAIAKDSDENSETAQS